MKKNIGVISSYLSPQRCFNHQRQSTQSIKSLERERERELRKQSGGAVMGCVASKNRCDSCEIDMGDFREKITLLQEEINEARCKREKESKVYQKQAKVFMVKEAEWKREKKKMREEVKRLRKKLEEREKVIRRMEDEMLVGRNDKEWQILGASILVEHMLEEQARRDEAIEKWKRLYLAIKTELDDLIYRTYQGKCLHTGGEANMMEELKRELKAKEEVIQALKAKMAAMDKEGVKREREVDILRQSLRIMSNAKKLSNSKRRSI
ncbi:PREDICTED: centrosomal protein of 290 kDa-like isoform X2 [Nelumbo nucifera]|uniref:Centrosomal protein of 290 kDa-like isoform X2 n=1 Tax=Nelumbo nucifera TaxID=4432 RepID=A0A1U8AB41_NELNU|nr:PREDICTED: centrosomal protein of 290 kDa-like isoform X2 [Nelumbo nucifera]